MVGPVQGSLFVEQNIHKTQQYLFIYILYDNDDHKLWRLIRYAVRDGISHIR